MSGLRKLASQTVIYGLSSIIGRTVNFLLVPFYTAIFISSEYGVINELYSYVAFFNVVYAFGLETAYFRFSNKEEFAEKNIFNSALTFIFLLSLLLSSLFYFGAGDLAIILEYNTPGQEKFIQWLAIILAIDAIVAIPFARLRFQNKAKTYAFLKLLNIFLNIGLNLFFFIVCKGVKEGEMLIGYSWLGDLYSEDIGVGYVFIANLVANAMYLPLMIKMFSRYRFRWRTEELKSMLKYAYPLMLMGLTGIVTQTLDRPLIKFLWKDNQDGLLGLAAVGIYGAVYKIAMLLSLGNQALRYAAEPFFFSKSKEKDSPGTFARVMDWYVIVACTIFVFLSINRNWIGDLVLGKEEYNQGLYIVPIILLALLFSGINFNLSIWFKLSDKTYWGTILTSIGAFITLVGNFILIPRIGYEGSAWTTLACYGIITIVSFTVGQKYYPVPYKVGKNILMIALSIIIVLISNYIFDL